MSHHINANAHRCEAAVSRICRGTLWWNSRRGTAKGASGRRGWSDAVTDQFVVAQAFAHVCDVASDLIYELIKIVEASLSAQVRVEGDLDQFAVEVAGEIEELGLDQAFR